MNQTKESKNGLRKWIAELPVEDFTREMETSRVNLARILDHFSRSFPPKEDPDFSPFRRQPANN